MSRVYRADETREAQARAVPLDSVDRAGENPAAPGLLQGRDRGRPTPWTRCAVSTSNVPTQPILPQVREKMNPTGMPPDLATKQPPGLGRDAYATLVIVRGRSE